MILIWSHDVTKLSLAVNILVVMATRTSHYFNASSANVSLKNVLVLTSGVMNLPFECGDRLAPESSSLFNATDELSLSLTCLIAEACSQVNCCETQMVGWMLKICLKKDSDGQRYLPWFYSWWENTQLIMNWKVKGWLSFIWAMI